MAIYFFFGLSTRPFEVIAISVAKCIVPYLVSEILKDKWRWPSAILFYNEIEFNDVTSRVDCIKLTVN